MTSDIAIRQRTTPSVKGVQFNWRVDVPNALREGAIFDKYDELTQTFEHGCHLKVDEYGFFVAWKSENNEGQVLELSQVSDVRYGPRPRLRLSKRISSSSTSCVEDLTFEEKQVQLLMSQGSGSLDQRVVTISSGLDLVNMNYTHMVARDPETAKVWIDSLRPLTHNSKMSNVCPMTQLKKHWIRLRFALNANGKIPVRAISKTFASGKTEKSIFQTLKDLNLPYGKNDEIDPNQFAFEHFHELYQRICPRTDIQDLFRVLSKNSDSITLKQMIDFINETQRDERLNEILYPFANKDSVTKLMEKYELDVEAKKAYKFTIAGFYRYLMSDDNAPVFLDKLDLHHDMDQPLSHYLINSSHNTYLVGRQFGGKSSVEIYRQVLLSGCRCVELDCWDGKGEDQEPIITHGKAMCTDVLFKDAIQAIADTAFSTSSYPVILSFENHCSKLQQYKLAKYCEDILGDYLLKKPLEDYPLEPGVLLPSPEKLRYKILIKNKRLRPEVEKQQLEMFLRGGANDVITEESETVEYANSVQAIDGEMGPLNDIDPTLPSLPEETDPHPEGGLHIADCKSISAVVVLKDKIVQAANKVVDINVFDAAGTTTMESSVDTILDGTSLSQESILTAEQAQAMLASYRYTGATTNIHPYLSQLVNYAQPVKFQGFAHAEDQNVHFHMSSFSESVALGYLKNEAIEFVNYNKRQMSRIYPRGNRVESSNFLPQMFWNAGCQMVALNFQTPDIFMQLNQGKFEYNGNSGYLLKPDFMRRPDRHFDPFSESPVDGVIAASCEVQIISGQFLSDKKIGTYVEVDMYGLPTDTIRKEFRTRIVPGNGLNPIFNDDPFVFRKIVLPDLAVLRFGVYEETGKLIGQRILPLDGLCAGYRHISLRTEGNFPLSLPTIFCRIDLKTYVPEGLASFVNALSDPRGFHSREEKRMKQMEDMGIETKDIVDVSSATSKAKKNNDRKGTGGCASGAGTGGGGVGLGSSNNNANSNIHMFSFDKKHEFEPITSELLRSDKSFMKLLRRQEKEVEGLMKRQTKERLSIHKKQMMVSDQLLSVQTKRLSLMEKLNKRNRNSQNGGGVGGSSSNDANDSDVQLLVKENRVEMSDLVVSQTDEWTNLIMQHKAQEYDLRRSHIGAQKELLVALMQQMMAQQKKNLALHHEREVKDTKAKQTRSSMENIKTVQLDKSIKSKAERDRRVKEVMENNTKRFMEERKRMQTQQEKHRDDMAKRHKENEAALLKSLEQERDLLDATYQESLLACRPATLI